MKKFLTAISGLAVAFSLTACESNETPQSYQNYYSNTNNYVYEESSSNTWEYSSSEKPEESSAPKKTKVEMFDILPEIDVTSPSAFGYRYDANQGGMVVFNYYFESPRIRIPDTLEGEAVVGVDMSMCTKQLTEVIMPDTVKNYKFSETTIQTIKYINHPRDAKKVNLCDYWAEAGKNHYRSLEAVYFAEGTTEISYGACWDNENLTTVYIPDSVTKIDTGNAGSGFKGAFSQCPNISITYKGKTYTYSQLYDLYFAINGHLNGLL